jgi:hypothetical protein
MRTVIEDECVSDVIDLEQTKFPRLADAFDALKWWLARRPENGLLMDDINWICKQNGDRDQNIPALVAIYTFDYRSVTIKFILVRIPAA